MVVRLRNGIDPFVVGKFQVSLDLLTRHLYDKKLVLKRIDSEKIIISENARRYVAVVSERRGEGDFRRLAAQAKRVDQVDVIAHPPIGVAGPEVRVQHTHLLEREGLDSLVILLEMRPHHRIGILRPYRNNLRLIGFGNDLVVLHLDVHLALGEIAAVTAGIQETAGIVGLHMIPVVMAGQNPVDTLHQMERVQALGFQHAAVTIARPGMHRNHHHVRMFLGLDLVHILLDDLHDGLEMHPAPETFRKPSLHIGVGIAQDGDLQASSLHNLVRLEIRLAIVIPDGIGRQEIHSVLL